MKSQVTVFIGLGVLVLLLAGALFYIFARSADDAPINPLLSPAERYVTDCLYQTSVDGLQLIGLQGGYIHLPEQYESPATYIQELTGGVKTASWIIKGRVVTPKASVVEEQLATYVEENLNKCIRNFKDVENVGDVAIKSVPNASASINKNDVTISLNYTLEVTDGTTKTTYKRYAAEIPLALMDILNTASYVTERHYQDLFLERTTVNILSMNPELFPLGDMTFSCERLRWSKAQIQSDLQDTLKYLIPKVRVNGTDFLPLNEPLAVYQRVEKDWSLERVESDGPPGDLPVDMYEYMQQLWSMGLYPWQGKTIGFTYFPEYGMRLEINPSSGDIVQANPGKSTSELLRFFCINVYHFTYDIEYPVKATIYDNTALNGAGYTFSFGLPVTVEHNIPTRTPVDFATFDASETDAQFCNTTFEDDTFVLVQDAYTGEYLNDVNITFDCTRYYCPLGLTGTDVAYGVAQVMTKLPRGCANGFFIAEKEGYVKSKVQKEDTSGAIDLEMIPLKKFPLTVLKMENGVFFTGDKASIYLSAKNTTYESFVTYPALNGDNSLELIAGPQTYDLEIVLTDDTGIIGGWYGNWTVTDADLESGSLQLFAYEWLPHPTTKEQQVAMYQYLSEDPITEPYRERLKPVFQ